MKLRITLEIPDVQDEIERMIQVLDQCKLDNLHPVAMLGRTTVAYILDYEKRD